MLFNDTVLSLWQREKAKTGDLHTSQFFFVNRNRTGLEALPCHVFQTSLVIKHVLQSWNNTQFYCVLLQDCNTCFMIMAHGEMNIKVINSLVMFCCMLRVRSGEINAEALVAHSTFAFLHFPAGSTGNKESRRCGHEHTSRTYVIRKRNGAWRPEQHAGLCNV